MIKKVCEHRELLEIIINRMNNVFDSKPKVVHTHDIFIRDESPVIYIERLATLMNKYPSYDFAVIPQNGEITDVITMYGDNLAIHVEVKDINERRVVYRIKIYNNDILFKPLQRVFDRLKYYYNIEYAYEAQKSLDRIFDYK